MKYKAEPPFMIKRGSAENQKFYKEGGVFYIMKLSRILIGAITGAFAGYGVFTIWPSALAHWHWLGGWLAAGLIITTAWWLNHYVNAFPNDPDGAWVDMALAIWLSSLLGGNIQLKTNGELVRASYGLYHGISIGPALVTIVLELIGATIAGYLLHLFRRSDA